MTFAQLPKVELHLHLDCSLSYQVVKMLESNISFETYQEAFIAPPKCTDLADYISRAVKGFELMQTPEALRLVTLDLFEQLQADQVVYAEIRFAPLLHLEKGLSPQEVVQIVNDAVVEGIQKTGIEVGIILCTLRHYSAVQSMETVQLVEQFQGTQVVGFDIAADEAGFPIDNHVSAFAYAQEKGLNVTAHAGEAKGADSVWETLTHFHPSRIGHGVRSVEDPQLLDHLLQKNIHLEVCPTSNVQTNVVADIASHPVDKLFRRGVSLSINTDARTISNVSLTSEYQTLQTHFNWDTAHFLTCNLAAIDHSFTSAEKKAAIRAKLLAGFGEG